MTKAGVDGWRDDVAKLKALRPRGILFLCVANSARSQMAEGIARSLAPPEVEVFSAGSRPTEVRPEAVEALALVGIDLAPHRSKGLDEIPAGKVEAVVTLCAEEVCPAWLGHAHRFHWGLPDPAVVEGEHRLQAFCDTRDELSRRLAILFG